MARVIQVLSLAVLLSRPVSSGEELIAFDVSRTFAFTQTATSLWQYGYSETDSLAPDQFRLDSYLDKLAPICLWHPSTNNRGGPGYYPYVAHNGSAKSETEPTHGWAARAGEVAMEASNTGQYSLVRFVVPVSGRYRITARFEGIHFRLSSTDVHILHGPVHLFDAQIDGYGGDPAFHVIEGTHPTASYEDSVPLKAGDTVSFAVGYGANKTNYNDTTGLVARLVLVEEAALTHGLDGRSHLRLRTGLAQTAKSFIFWR